MQVTDELRVCVEAEVARAIENFKKLEGSIDGAEHKTESLGEALDSFSKKSTIISAALGGAGIAAIKFAGENEKLKLSLKNMLGSADEASAVFEEWRRLGNSPGLSTDEVFEFGRAMVNMGYDTASATKTMQMLGNVAAGTGKSFGTISGVFEHVRAAGKLTTRDLTSIQQQGIPVLKQLAKELNTSEEGVRRLANEGKIGFPELEKAFKGMTGPGGQFAGMMDELSNTTLEKFSTAAADAKQAIASFGELMLPMATELLGTASSMLRGITDMDEGTKRFVLGMGGIVAVSGPAISAIKGISAAMKILAANPAMLVIGGSIAAIGAAVGAISSISAKMNQESKNYNASVKEMIKKNQELRQSAEFDDVSRRIRGLANNMSAAARETRNFDAATIGIMTRAQSLISILETPVNPDSNPLNWVDEAINGYASEINKINDALEQLNMDGWGNLYAILQQTPGWVEAVASQSSEAMLEILRSIDGVTIHPSIEVAPPDIATSKKRWQEWYGEITKIDPTQFGDSGAQAAELYLTEFTRSIEVGKTVFAALGEEFDIAGTLRSRQADIQKTLTELFSINPADIDQGFSAIDESIKPLIAEYQRMGRAAKEAEDAVRAAASQEEFLDRYNQQIQEIGKSQNELAMAAYAATGATEEQIAAFKATLNLRDELLQAEELKKTLEGIGTSLRDLGASSTLGGIEALGTALGQGANAGESMRDALASMHQEILNALPNLFLQAGLQLISQGQWPLGLGFVAAAGSTALIKGYVGGRIESEREVAQANAHGNVFDTEGIRAFAHGSAFTNQIVSAPTYFRHGGGLGLMGEAGPEAIMPLKRMANGDLGVAANGGSGPTVTVNIINNSGAEVRQEERTGPGGDRQIDIIIGDIVGAHIAQGRHDSALESRFDGLRRRGR